MKKRALIKDIFVEIKRSRNRYLSLFLLTMLGVAFFSGVRATGPDMRLSADQYYDDSNLMDIRVVGTYGLTQEDVDAIADVNGVEEVIPAYRADVLSEIGEQQEVLRLMSMSDPVNKVDVTEGRLPEAENECLVDSSVMESSGYEIGDTISVYAGGDGEIEDTLAVTEFTIVGSGTSSYYISFDRGSSSIGRGSVYGFVIVSESAFSLEAYTDIYVTVTDALDLTSYTDEYNDAVSAVIKRIEAIAGERSEIRYADILEQAKTEIAEAKEEIAQGEDELAAAALELEDAKAEIEAGRREIQDGKTKIADGWAEIEASEKSISAAQSDIDAGWTEIASGKAEVERGRAQLTSARQQISSQYATVQEGRRQLSEYEQQVTQAQAQLEESRELLRGLRAQEAAGDTSVSAQIAQLEAAISETERELAAAQEQIYATSVQLTAGEESLAAAGAQLDLQEAELLQAEAKISQSENSLRAGQAELNSAKAQLAAARQTLKNSEAELEVAAQELEDGEAELIDGQAEYEQARDELQSAKLEIESAEDKLVKLETPEWYVLSRQSIQDYVEYGENANRIEAIGTVFPLIFFIVAALVCLTSMTRMVEEQRTQIGCLKALGYSKWDIAAKYIVYALSASLLGSLAGMLIGQSLFPLLIIDAYKSLYQNFPNILTPLNFEFSMTATGAAIVCMAAATVAACYKETLSVPAKLMRPPSPKSGKRICLERISFIWKRMNFSSKATARNLFRYKKRMLMTLFGIGACMSLLVVAFGMNDSISDIGGLQFSKVNFYDASISIADDATSEDREDLLTGIKEDPDVKHSALVMYSTVDVSFEDSDRNAYLLIPENPEEIRQFISLQNRKTGENYELTDDGVVITEKLASLLDVSVGDRITLKEGERGETQVTVSAITENYFYHYVYISPTLYETIFGETPDYNTVLTINMSEGEEFERIFGDIYMENDAVSAVSFISDLSVRLQDMLKSMDFIIYVLIVSAGLLAFVVLYNLNNVNVSERLRELATLKVLGFYDSEVSAYVIRENIWLTAIGAVIGAFLGKVLHQYVIATAEVDLTMFGREISWQSYLFSIILTFAFSGIVNLVMHFKLKKINMVESMKSVE